MRGEDIKDPSPPHASEDLRFIADSMLGRLSRWLRLLGYDTLYFPTIEDNKIIRIARSEGRILLTRDTRLIKEKGVGVKFLLLTSNDTVHQVLEVIKIFGLMAGDMKRCALCNGVLKNIEKASVQDSVPEYVYLNFSSFMKCTECGKVYWQGSHIRRFRDRFEKMISVSSESNQDMEETEN